MAQLSSALFAGLVQIAADAKSALAGTNGAASPLGSFGEALAALEGGAQNAQPADSSLPLRIGENLKSRKLATKSLPASPEPEKPDSEKALAEGSSASIATPAELAIVPVPQATSPAPMPDPQSANAPASGDVSALSGTPPAAGATPGSDAIAAPIERNDAAPQPIQARGDGTAQTFNAESPAQTHMAAASLALPALSDAKAQPASPERNKSRVNAKGGETAPLEQGAATATPSVHETHTTKTVAPSTAQQNAAQAAGPPSATEALQQPALPIEARANVSAGPSSANMQDVSAPPDASPAPHIAHVAVHIAKNVKAGNSEFKIKLSPEELGSIDVKLEMSVDGKLRASLIVERPETLDLLTRDAKSLEQSLRQTGLDLSGGDLNFSLKEERPQGQERQSPFARGIAIKEEAAEAANETLAPYQAPRGLLDIKV